MQNIDTLISSRWTIPVLPANTVLDNHALAIDKGKIVQILPSSQASNLYQAKQTIVLDRHALIPGLVNAHTHAAMTLFRGMADDMSLDHWLQQRIWPAESRWVSESFVADGCLLAFAEMLRSGTTCFADMYYFPDIVARTAKQAHIRACVGLIVLDFPTVWANDAAEYLHKGTALHDQLHHEALASTIFAPHAPYTVSDEPLRKIATLADELEIPIMCHIHETAQEIEDAVQQTGRRPLQRLDDLGLLSPALNAVHMTQLEKAEIARLAEAGAHVIHCPESNMKLASGFCPVAALLESGVNVALGTDGAASNNDLDMFGEMRSAALLAKNVANDASVVPGHTALAMATINGARALGLADDIGSLEAGKAADIVAVDLNEIKTQPVYDPVSQIVYAADSSQVSDVWVGGKRVLKQGELTTLNIDEIIHSANIWRDKIQARQD